MDKFLLKKIFYCPVKSLSFNESHSIEIINKIGIKNDRCIAFTRGLNKKESNKFNQSKIRNLNFFLTLKNSPFLKKYNFLYKDIEKCLYLYNNNEIIIKTNIFNSSDIKKMEKYIENLDYKIKKPIYLIFNDKLPFFDTTPDVSISLININSIKDIENKVQKKIDQERFRGNFLIDNLPPWYEFKLLDKILKIGNVKFKVISKIPRCSATNVNPNNFNLDINIPHNLMKFYGHKDMGIYLKPLNSGIIINNTDVLIN